MVANLFEDLFKKLDINRVHMNSKRTWEVMSSVPVHNATTVACKVCFDAPGGRFCRQNRIGCSH